MVNISTIKTKKSFFILYCLRFAVTLDKLRCISTIKTKNSFFILYCLRFAVTLQSEIK